MRPANQSTVHRENHIAASLGSHWVEAFEPSTAVSPVSPGHEPSSAAAAIMKQLSLGSSSQSVRLQEAETALLPVQHEDHAWLWWTL